MPRKIDPAVWESYFAYREQGLDPTHAAREAGISRESALRFEHTGAGSGAEVARTLGLEVVAGVVVERNLSAAARRGLKDFGYFRKRYMGRRSVPWQVMAGNQVVEAIQDEANETRMVTNAPPGTGKSTAFTHDIPCWLIARNRDIRIMLGSRTEHQATKYGRQIRTTLERRTPITASTRDLKLKMATDAEAVLAADYGTFQSQTLWRADQFIVTQPGDVGSSHKDATVTCYGMDSGFLGGRFDVVIWDDLVDKKNMRTEAMRAEVIEWWDSIAEARIEPWGVFILQGQRMTAEDLYRYCLDKRDEKGNPVYIPIKFPAHDESRCVGRHDLMTPWPDTCLLDPKRLPWPKLASIAASAPKLYSTVYQQEDIDPEQTLIQPLWLKGGVDELTGQTFPGCLDARVLYGVPEWLKDGSAWSVVTVDPSPTKWWAVQWWGYHPQSDSRVLLFSRRAKMSTTDFLTMDLDTHEFGGLVDRLRVKSLELGLPIETVIVERNAAQRFMLQSPIWARWLTMYDVHLIPHETQANKSDPNYGVESLQTPIKMGKYRLPGSSDADTKTVTERLIYELTHYPAAQDSDQVMAMWFFEHHLAKSWSPKQTHYTFSRPGYLTNAKRGLAEPEPKGPRMRIRFGGSNAESA